MQRINQYIFYLFAVYPFFGWFCLTFLGNSPDRVMFILCFIVFLFILYIKKNKNIIFPKYLVFFSLYFIYVTILDFLYPEKYYTSIIQYLYNNRGLRTIFILFIIENTNIHFFTIKKITKILKFVFVISVIVSVIQIFQYSFFINPNISEARGNILFTTRQTSLSIYSWIGHMSLGLVFIPIYSILFGLFLLKKKNIYLISIASALFAFLTKARWVMLNYFIVLIQQLVYKKISFVKIVKYATSVIIIVFVGYYFLTFVGVNVKKTLQSRIFETDKNFEEKSASTRVFAFTVFAELFPENPWFGARQEEGVEEELESVLQGRSSQIHVGWLSLFFYSGIVGGTIYVLFIYYLMKKLKLVATKTGFWGSYFAFLCFIAANCTLYYINIFEAGLILALVYNKYIEQELVKGNQNIEII